MMSAADAIVEALLKTYPEWPTAALSEMVLRCFEIKTRHSDKHPGKTRITFSVDTSYIDSMQPTIDGDGDGRMEEEEEGGHDPIERLSITVHLMLTEGDVDKLINDICYRLMQRSSVDDMVKYIAENMSFHMRHRTPHIGALLQSMGALFIRGPVWYNLMQVRRVDIIGLTCASLRQLLGVTTTLLQHIVITKILTEETYIDGTTALGAKVARAFIQTCMRATTDALISVHLSRAECEDKAVANSSEDSPAVKRPVSVCIASHTGWHLVLIKEYDLLFVWLALLFDFYTLYWNTPSCQWGESVETSPAPTIMKALRWKEKNNTSHDRVVCDD